MALVTPVPFVDLKRQHARMAADLHNAFSEVVEGSSFVLGSAVTSFERSFAATLGAQHCVGVGSGTDALHIALLACGVGPGDEVILPSHTFVASALAVSWTGAKPVFVDVDPTTYSLDPDQVAAAIRSRTRAIMPVHLYGRCTEMAPLLSIAAEHGLRIIEDAAQAHGALDDGHAAGTIGDIGCFSFYPTKNLGGLGDGGAMVSNDASLAERCRLLRNYGEAEKYRSETMGFNSRLDDLQAAFLAVKLPHLMTWNHERRQIAARYRQLLDPNVHVPRDEGERHVYHLFVVDVPHRDRVRARLSASGIRTGIHYPIPAHLQPSVAAIPQRRLKLDVTERIAGRVLSLPMFPGLSDLEIERVAQAVNDAVANG